MFETIRKRLESKYTPQPEEPDKDDFQEEFEPDDPKTYEHLYTVSDVQIEAVRREIKKCNEVYPPADVPFKLQMQLLYLSFGMLKALELLGLPS
jgi:hypothetical protein